MFPKTVFERIFLPLFVLILPSLALAGEIISVPVGRLLPDSQLLPATGEAVWTRTVTRPGAATVSASFSQVDLGDDWLLYIYSSQHKETEFVDSAAISTDGRFLSKRFAGHKITMELIPLTDSPQTIPSFRLDSLGFEFTSPDSPEAARARVEAAVLQYRGDAATPDDRVIYGTDDRVEVYAEPDVRLQEMAGSVAMMFPTSDVRDNGNGTITLLTSPWTTTGAFGGPVCEDERFYGQEQFGLCTAFLVGDDLIVTAGHCTEALGCGSSGFVFDFQYLSAEEGPELTLPADQVYYCSEIIESSLEGDLDHAVLRLDRRVRDRAPLAVRRSDILDTGDALTIIGHPLNLPKKIAGNAEVTNATPADEWFQANLDSFAGNSGSPVIDSDTFEVVGVLVRGATDYRMRDEEECNEVNQVPDTGNTGGGLMFEEISRISTFADLIPEVSPSRGRIWLDREFYSVDSEVEIEVFDGDLADDGQVEILVEATSADPIPVTMIESKESPGRFFATLQLSSAGTSGTLAVNDGDTLTATYNDQNTGLGNPGIVTAEAMIDAGPPTLVAHELISISGVSAQIELVISEPAIVSIPFGTECGQTVGTAEGSIATTHTLAFRGLVPQTRYYYSVGMTDQAGNTSIDDQGGSCYSFVTLDKLDYFTERFPEDYDLSGKSLSFIPSAVASGYVVCRDEISELPVPPEGTVLPLADNDFVMMTTTDHAVRLYGQQYRNVYIGSNGYVTFGGGDLNHIETLVDHFAMPRVSAMFDDLDPTAGGQVTWQELDDRVVASWVDVPERLTFGTTAGSVTAQIELHFDGRIVVSVLENERSRDGLTGLSAGSGLPEDFDSSDLSAYATCPLGTLNLRFLDPFVSCNGDARIELSGASLEGPTQEVTITGADGDIETIELQDDGAGFYVGSVPLTGADATIDDGVVSVDDGAEVFASFGSLAGASVTVDCQAPLLESIIVAEIGSVNARIRVSASELSFFEVNYGNDCDALASVVATDQAIDAAIELINLMPESEVSYRVTTTDLAGNSSTSGCTMLSTRQRAEWYAEDFAAGNQDMSNRSILFIRDNSPGGYSACTTNGAAMSFPTSPEGATILSLGDDDAKLIDITPHSFSFYGIEYNSFYVSSNGYLTFGQREDDHTESIEDHFRLPRISGLYNDLDPLTAGDISYELFDDRTVVTFDGVAELGSSSSTQSFQIELFYDDSIRITWLEINSPTGVAGISPGGGVPSDFQMADMSAIVGCDSAPSRFYFVRNSHGCEETMQLTLQDSALAGTGPLEARVESPFDSELVGLSESHDGYFTGMLPLTVGDSSDDDGALRIADNAMVTASWPATGDAQREASTQIDCAPPQLLDVRTEETFDDSARISYNFDEPTTSRILVGTSCGQGFELVSANLQLEHIFTIDSLESGTDYYFVVEATDEAGNFLRDDNGGACYQFRTTGTAPVPEFLEWDFESDAEGWFSAVPPQFAAVDLQWSLGALEIATSDNTNTFGYWQSPLFSIMPLDLMESGSNLLDVQWQMSSNLADTSVSPGIRFRLSTEDFALTDALSAESTGSGALSPGEAQRTYRQIASMPASAENLRLDLDVLSFNPADAAESVLRLDRVTIAGTEYLIDTAREELALDFTGQQANGFTPRMAEPLAVPVFESTDGGLSMTSQADADPEVIGFGYWGFESGLALEGGRVYRFEFEVTTDASTDQLSRIPAFRLRVNDSELQTASVLNVESTAETMGDLPPGAGDSRVYAVFLLVPDDADGRTAVMSFDWIYAPGSGNDLNIAVVLSRIGVTSQLSMR